MFCNFLSLICLFPLKLVFSHLCVTPEYNLCYILSFPCCISLSLCNWQSQIFSSQKVFIVISIITPVSCVFLSRVMTYFIHGLWYTHVVESQYMLRQFYSVVLFCFSGQMTAGISHRYIWIIGAKVTKYHYIRYL